MADRICRKCGIYIPTQTVIDGKRKSLQNRKFCLTCSPYKSHNTKHDDPARKAKRKSNYAEWDKEAKLLHTARVYKRGIERKEKLIELAGGKCKLCGYNKCNRALTFHHRNPSEKEFGFALNVLWSTAWDKILREFEKCDLLCCRCHMELEDELALVNEKSYRKIIEEM